MKAKSYYGGTDGACSRGHPRALPEHSSVRIMNGVCHENKRTPYPLCHSFFYRRYLRDSFLPFFSPLLSVPHYVTGLLDHSLSQKKRKMYLPLYIPRHRPTGAGRLRPRLPANAACNSTGTGRPAQNRHEAPARHSRPAPGYPKGNSGRRTLQQRQEGNLYSSRLYIRYTRSGETCTQKGAGFLPPDGRQKGNISGERFVVV